MSRCRLSIILLLLFSAPAYGESRKLALVIGNERYEHAARLANPARDAAAIARSLRKLGFLVDERSNLGRAALESAFSSFSKRSAVAETAWVYFAGHGLEIGGHNYLVPVDARLAAESDVPFETVPLDMAIAATGSAQLRLVLVDACRNNPLARVMKGSRRPGQTSGLAPVAPPPDTLVVFATRAGELSVDGRGRNSPFAQALIELLPRSQLPVPELFGLVRQRVQQLTNGLQDPYVYGELASSGAFNRTLSDAGPPQSSPQDDNEDALWQAASSERAGLIRYLEKYPRGKYVKEAVARLEALEPTKR